MTYIKAGFFSVVIAITGLLVFSSPLFAQTAEITKTVPPQSLLGEQFCYTTRFENVGTPGFGPYLRVSLPPEVQGDSVSIFGNVQGSLITPLGAFPAAPGNQINDPKIDELVTGTPGNNFYLITLPVGAVVEGGPTLDLEICATIDADATLGTPLDIITTPVYQFGDTATGLNGPIVGQPVTQSTTPAALLLEKSNTTPESQRPPGSIWPYNYSLTANIANGVSVTPVVLNDTLPPDFQFNGSLNITGGGNCSATQLPSTLTPGGSLEITCTNVPLGQLVEDDIVVTYGGYITDILNELSCDQQDIINQANGTGTYVPTQGQSETIITDEVSTTVMATHLAVQKQANPTNVGPNAAVTFTLDTQVTEFDSVIQLTIVDTLPDGLSFVSHGSLTVNGSPVPTFPTVVLNANSTTTVTYNIVSAAGPIPAGSSIELVYNTVVLENYLETGNPVLSGDSLSSPTQATFQLTSGTAPCTDSSSATVSVAPTFIDKTLLDPQPLYRPGDEAVFQLTQTIPAGSTNQIVFSDYLPIPAFAVSDLDLNSDIDNAPGSVRRGTADTAGLNPTSITINNPQNLVTVAWPNAVSSTSQVIQILLTATVSGEPFADGLFLTNIFQSEDRNTAGAPYNRTDTETMTIGAPSLTITKGVSATDGQGVISPPAAVLPVDGNITGADGNDTISFVITIENTGNALAHDVLIRDPGAAPVLQSCTIASVEDSNGGGLATSGNLATGLTLTDPLGYANPVPADLAYDNTALITVNCQVSPTVAPDSTFENTATVTWAALPGAAPYPEQADIANGSIRSTSIQKLFVDTSEPGTSDTLNPPRVTIGEIVRYRLILQLPEGEIAALNFRDRIPNQLQFLDDGTATVAFVSSNGNISSNTLAIPNIIGNSATIVDVPSSSITYAVPAGAIVGAPFEPNEDPRFNLGSVINNDSDNDAEYVIMELNAIVNNVNGANSGVSRSNRFAAYSANTNLNGNSNQVQVRIAEPQLTISKTASPATGDAGDVISYEITIRNANGNNFSPAYEVELNDVLPTGLTGATNVIVGAANGACTDLGEANNSVGDSLSFSFDVMQPNCLVEVSFDATLTNDVAPGTTINNTANVTWSSLDGTNGTSPNPTGSLVPGTPGSATGERDGSGGVNDYNVSASGPVNVPGVGIAKIVSGTDEASSGTDQHRVGVTDLLVGEQATFLLTVTVPEGLTPSLVVTDTLPYTNGVMRLESAQVVAGSIGSNLNVQFPNPVASVDDLQLTDGTDDTASFDFGQVTNTPDGATNSDDQLQIEVVATLINVQANQNGDQLNNQVLVQFGPGLDASTTTPLDVIEPELAVTKSGSISQGDAGDPVTYTVEINHTNGSTAIAQDLVVTDSLPADLLLNLASIVVVDGPNFTVNNSSGNTLALGWTNLPLNTSIELQYQAELQSSAESGDSITNTADVEWDSIPGPDPDERTNSVDDSHLIIITQPGVNKVITDTSEPGTDSGQFGSADDLTIGEVVTYQFTVELPEGTSPNSVVYDQLPTGSSVLEVVSSRLVSIGSSLSGPGLPALNTPGTASDTGTDLIDDRVTWTLGEILNTPDGASNDNDLLTFEVIAVVLDLPINQSGLQDQLNLANASSTLASGSGTAPIDIVAPDVTLSKSIVTPADGFVDAGDPVISRLIIDHDNNSTADSYTNLITDSLPVGLSWVNDSTVSSDCPGLITDSSATTVITFTVPALTLAQDSCQIEYELVVDNFVQPSQNLQNSALLSYDSTPVFVDGQTRQRESSDVAEVVVVGPSLIKLAVDTSEPDTTLIQGDPTLLDLTIGETVTYQLTVVLPEGVLQNAVLTDFLPVGANGVIEAIGASVTAFGSQLSTTLPGTPVLSDDQDVDGYNDTVTLDFGTITNAPDGQETAADRIVVEIVGRVVDVPVNQDGLILTNLAELTSDTVDLDDSADVEVVAPVLSLDKNMSLQNNGFVRITIELDNTGTAPAYDIEANDILSDSDWLVSSLTPVSISSGFELDVLPDTPNAGEQSIRISSNPLAVSPAGTIPVGETISATFDVQLAVLPPDPNPLPNEVTLDAADTLPGDDDNARDLPTLDANDNVALPELQLLKTGAQLLDTDNSGTISAGDTLRYTLALENIGVAVATNLTIDDVPDGNSTLVVGSVTTTDGTVNVGNTAADTTIQISIPTLGVGGTVTMIYDTVINNPLPAGVEEVVNQAIVDSDELLPTVSDDPTDPTGDIDPTVIPIEAQPDLTLTKDDGGVTAIAGGTVSWALGYDNVGTQEASGVVITDVVPLYTTFEPTSSTAGWTCVPDTTAGSVCSLPLGDLTVSNSGSVIFTVTVDAALPAGIELLSNSADIADDGTNGADPTPDNNLANDTTPLDAVPDLAILKDDGGDTAVPGQLLTWNLQVTNVGSQEASGVVVTDTVPDNTTFNAGASTSGWSCSPDNSPGSVCTINIGDVAVGDVSALAFTVLIDNPLNAGVSRIDNTANVSDDGLNGQDPNLGNNEDSDFAPTGTSIDLAITKSDGGITVEPGDVIAYTLNYSNLGNQGVSGVVITETVPLHTSFDAGNSTPGWVCPSGITAGSSCTLAAGLMNGGATGTATFAVVVNAAIPESINAIFNSVSITDDGANGPDSNPANNASTDTTPLDAVPDLAIVKSDGGATAVPGQLLSWDLQVTNIGNQGASGVVVTDIVPANSTFDAGASTPGWNCVPDAAAGSQCTIDIGIVEVGDLNSLSFTVLVDDPLNAGVTQIDNTATVNDDGLNGQDPDLSNNTDSDIAPTGTSIDLEINKTDGGMTAEPGDLIPYSLSYTNLGNQGVTGVVITETVPLNTTFDVANSTSGWACTPNSAAGSSCTLATGDLAGGGQGTAIFAVVLDDPIPESVTEVINAVSITDDGTNGVDTNPTNNQADDTTPVDTSVALGLVKSLTDAPEPIDVGSVLEYTLVATNEGNSALTNVIVADNLITPTGGTTPCDRLEPTETCTLIGTYEVTQADMDLGTIENTGTASSDQTPPVEDTVIVPIDQSAVLELVKQATLVDTNYDGQGSAGESIDYELVATNNGNTTLTDVVIDDPLLGELTCLPEQPAVLTPGQTLTCSGSYIITFDDVIKGSVVNVAEVTGESPDGEELTDTDSAVIPTKPIAPVPVMNNYAIAILLLLMTLAAVKYRRRLFA